MNRLSCPDASETAQQPFRSNTWAAAMHIVYDRDGGDLSWTRRLGLARFEHMVRGAVSQFDISSYERLIGVLQVHVGRAERRLSRDPDTNRYMA